MYYNPEYMNPIMKGLNQPSQPQQGIASLAPTPPTQATPPTQGIHNQQFIDPGVGQFNPTPMPGFGIVDARDKTLPTLQFPEGTGPLQPSPGSIFPFPGMDSTEVSTVQGPWDHLTDNPYAAGPPDNFVTIEGVRHYVGGAQQATPPQPPTAPPLTQTAPPQTNYSPGVMPPGWQNQQPFNPNQGIASLAGTNPGI